MERLELREFSDASRKMCLGGLKGESFAENALGSFYQDLYGISFDLKEVVGRAKMMEREGDEIPEEALRVEVKVGKSDFIKLVENLESSLGRKQEKVEGEDYLEALKHLLREIYRIKVRGLPKPEVIRTDKRKVEEARAERQVVVIDDTEDKFFESFGVASPEDLEEFKEKANPKKFLERIAELFSQRFGFLVIYGTEERLSQVQNVLAPVEGQIPKWYEVKLKEFNLDRKSEVASSVWGFVEPSGITGESFDDSFLKCENLFWDSLEGLVKTPEYDWVRESVEGEEGIEGYESSLHYLAKIFGKNIMGGNKCA